MLLLTPQSLRGILPENEAIFFSCPDDIKCSDYQKDYCDDIYHHCDCACKYDGNKCKDNGSCKPTKKPTKKPSHDRKNPSKKPTKKPSKDDRKNPSPTSNQEKKKDTKDNKQKDAQNPKNLLLEVEEQVSTSGSGSQDSESLDGYGSEDEVAGSGDSSVSDSGDGGTVYFYNEEDVLNSV